MLTELRIRNLGVVEDVTLVMHPEMTAVTGETGAGKTMLIEAIRLLSGARAEPHVIRSGADEALIEGRFVNGDDEIVLSRAIPSDGRSRGYVDGRMSTVSALSEVSANLVELHAQNAHQSLLTPQAQRDALDRFANIDTTKMHELRNRTTELEEQLNRLGGDAQARAREIDLLRYQLDEIERANLDDPDESERLAREEEMLADVTAHREAAEAVHSALGGDAAAVESVARAIAAAGNRQPLADISQRLQAVNTELEDLLLDSTRVLDQLVDDPEALAIAQDRRHILRGLEKKYGPSLGDVISFRNEIRERLRELENHDESVAELEGDLLVARHDLELEQQRVFEARKAVAGDLTKAIEKRLRTLALPNARFDVAVEQTDKSRAGEVTFGLSANPGMPVLPIAKAASGGELSRTMLALHLGLLGNESAAGHRTLIFDEVDAGVGGEAAVSIGKALSELAHAGNQVLVVTHLPQVAACADHQLSVSKQTNKNSTATTVVELADAEREIELARMLAGRPDSESGRAHARELMDNNKSTKRRVAKR